jgi:hypothetical protein
MRTGTHITSHLIAIIQVPGAIRVPIACVMNAFSVPANPVPMNMREEKTE